MGIVGESGCGKSTMARMTVGLELPTSGEVRFAGKTIGKWLKEGAILLQQSVQVVFQDPSASLNPRQRIREILELQLQRLTDFRAEQRTQRMEEVLVRCNFLWQHLNDILMNFRGTGTKNQYRSSSDF